MIYTDLHCHILPGIDDGAADIEISRALLEAEVSQGIKQIAFTPHFYADRKSLKQFLRDRYEAALQLSPILEELEISWSAGAEVRMVPELLNMDLSALRYVDTDYLLLEWPFTQFPLWGSEIVDHLFDEGMTPVFAHIERYDYFWSQPQQLDEYIENGVLCQINATALIRQQTRKQALSLIKKGYVHLISSDAHNMDKRPVRMKTAYDLIERELGKAVRFRLAENADRIFHGKEVDTSFPAKKFSLFG